MTFSNVLVTAFANRNAPFLFSLVKNAEFALSKFRHKRVVETHKSPEKLNETLIPATAGSKATIVVIR